MDLFRVVASRGSRPRSNRTAGRPFDRKQTLVFFVVRPRFGDSAKVWFENRRTTMSALGFGEIAEQMVWMIVTAKIAV
ncbi:hypothetical protein ABZV58_19395 [Nocardia sp. NPDC004654]|uniref:hypothetical protein n=1 Tax=Nocardia sp. NPDC004654 TaxID=3154776 RepID=UPI0033BC0345